jgi:uncharacterized membrane protein YeaQ/YmgE (transglycosylase-associated protein family)
VRSDKGGLAEGEPVLQLFWQCFIGLTVGLLAIVVMPGIGTGGNLVTALLAIAGAIMATNLGHMTGFHRRGSKAGCMTSVLGAVLLLLVYRMFGS